MGSYADLSGISEDEQVAIIGRQAEGGKLIGFVVEDSDKADRYIAKLLKSFRVRVVSQGSGPVVGTILVKVGPVYN